MHHAPEKIIGDKLDGAMTRNNLKGTCFLTKFEPSLVIDALVNESWIKDINEEIEKIERNQTQTPVPRPKDKNIFGTKWVFRNNQNEDGEVSRKKPKIVCKGYSQEECINYGETSTHIARLEGVRTLLAYDQYKGFKVYQVDVKSTFFNGALEEEVYIDTNTFGINL